MKSEKAAPPSLDKIISLCKQRGFVFPSAELYGGINGIYDIGPLGTLLKQNLRIAWFHSLQNEFGQIIPFEGAILGPKSMWKASGHIDGFHDPMIDCRACKQRFRADDVKSTQPCACGKHDWTDVRSFNLMFSTRLGAVESEQDLCYLRPETAQALFVNFKHVMSTMRTKIPFGIAQIGKAFRNEITPKQFLCRMREFEQMELEWFCHPDDALSAFSFWVKHRKAFYKNIGIREKNIRLHDHTQSELAHYAIKAIDIEYHFPFGWKELEGIHHRGDFDLVQHEKHSKKNLHIHNEEQNSAYLPNVIECSVGTDRLLLTLLYDAYEEDDIDGQLRTVLRLAPRIAPIKAAFLSLSKKLASPTEKLYQSFFEKGISVQIDHSGSIGKRYRRQDEIGTPFCVTYDFESETDHCVTIRDRDTTTQKRISIDTLFAYIAEKIA